MQPIPLVTQSIAGLWWKWSATHLWLPSLRPQEGGESGQLSVRAFEPTQTPTAALQAYILTIVPNQARHQTRLTWGKEGARYTVLRYLCLANTFDYSIDLSRKDHRRGDLGVNVWGKLLLQLSYSLVCAPNHMYLYWPKIHVYYRV